MTRHVAPLYGGATLAIIAGVVLFGFDPIALYWGFLGVLGLGILFANLRSVEATVETKFVLVMVNLMVYFLGVALAYLVWAGYIDLSGLR